MLLARHLLAEGVQNTRRFENRAGTDIVAENLRRVRRRAGHAQLPSRGAATRGDGIPRIARSVLEPDRHIGSSRGCNQRLASLAQRTTWIFLVTSHDDGEVHVLQDAGRVERFERLHDDDVAALHVDDARTLGGLLVDALEFLERTVGLEHGIEMPDQENPDAAAGMFRHEMAGAAPFRSVDPRGLEAKPVECRTKDRAHLAHAGVVLRAAVDVDHALEERQSFSNMRVDVRRDCALRRSSGLKHRKQRASRDHIPQHRITWECVRVTDAALERKGREGR